MAFDSAQFDLSGFDVGGSGTVLFSVFISEKVTAVLGTSQEIGFVATGGERMNTEPAKGGNGVFIFASGEEEFITATATAESSTIIGRTTAAETTAAEAVCRSVNYLTIIGSEIGSVDAVISSDVYAKGSAKEVAGGQAITDKETWLLVQSYELMSASATLEAVDIEVCELNLRLEPGQRLVIDAANYNVLLDGENAIEVQRGVWLDHLSRNTSSISVTAASGTVNLSASILYTEQYL